MAKVNLEINAKDNGASAMLGNITKSMISGQLVVEGLKKAWQFLSQTVAQSIQEFKAQEQAESKLKVLLGENISALTDFSNEIQKTTTYTDDAVLSMQQLGLTMGISKEKINQASKEAIGLSEALGIDLDQAMKMIAPSYEGNTNMLSKYLPALKNANTEAEKQAIIQKAVADGFDMAKAKAETFTGKLEMLKNANSEIKEGLGRIVSIVGKDIVEGFLKGATAIADFLNSANTIQKIGAGFEVLKTVAGDMFGSVFTEGKKALKDIVDSFKNLFLGVGQNINGWEILSFLIKNFVLQIVLGIKTIKLIIQTFIDLMTVLKRTGDLAVAVGQALADPKNWANAKKALENLGDSFDNLGTNAKDNVLDIVKTTSDHFKNLNTDMKEQAGKYSQTWLDANKKISDDIKDKAKIEEEIIKTSGKTKEQIQKENLEKTMTQISDWHNSMMSVVSEALSIAQEAWSEFYDQQFEKLNEAKESNLEEVDDWTAQEMEKRGVAQKSKSELLQQEIIDMQNKMQTEKDAEQQNALEKSIKEKQAELTREQILEAGEKKKEKIQKDAAKKETALKKKQFEENKAWSIANVWVNASTAVMGFWSSLASMGIAGIILAGIMTTAVLAMAGAQTGVIASQSFHGEQGGVIGQGSGSGDNVMLNANKGEALLKSDDYNKLLEYINNTSNTNNAGVNINYMTVQTNDPMDFVKKLREIKRYEGVR